MNFMFKAMDLLSIKKKRKERKGKNQVFLSASLDKINKENRFPIELTIVTLYLEINL